MSRQSYANVKGWLNGIGPGAAGGFVSPPGPYEPAQYGRTAGGDWLMRQADVRVPGWAERTPGGAIHTHGRFQVGGSNPQNLGGIPLGGGLGLSSGMGSIRSNRFGSFGGNNVRPGLGGVLGPGRLGGGVVRGQSFHGLGGGGGWRGNTGLGGGIGGGIGVGGGWRDNTGLGGRLGGGGGWGGATGLGGGLGGRSSVTSVSSLSDRSWCRGSVSSVSAMSVRSGMGPPRPYMSGGGGWI